MRDLKAKGCIIMSVAFLPMMSLTEGTCGVASLVFGLTKMGRRLSLVTSTSFIFAPCSVVSVCAVSFFSLCAHAQDVEQVLPFALNAPKHEVRGVWLTTLWGLDWPKTRGSGSAVAEKQKADLCRILDELSRDGQ